MAQKLGYCAVSISPVRAESKDPAEIVTQLLFGELVEVLEMEGNWFRINTFSDNYPGWIDGKHIRFLSEKEVKRWQDGLTYQRSLVSSIRTPWGKQNVVKGSFIPFGSLKSFNIGQDQFEMLEQQVDTPLMSVFELAKEYLNTPYLWGGKTPFGIDCSGLVQMVFRFFEINLPRDASQQVEHGSDISFDEAESGDLAFFHNKNGKIIHVGIVGEEHSIIHASGQVRIDQLTPEGIIHNESGSLTHTLNCLKRY